MGALVPAGEAGRWDSLPAVELPGILSTAEVLDDYRAKQLEFLQAEISNMQANIKRLVLLTHIPPFMSSVDEKEGWANWKQVYRKQILDLLSEPRVPMLRLGSVEVLPVLV